MNQENKTYKQQLWDVYNFLDGRDIPEKVTLPDGTRITNMNLWIEGHVNMVMTDMQRNDSLRKLPFLRRLQYFCDNI